MACSHTSHVRTFLHKKGKALIFYQPLIVDNNQEVINVKWANKKNTRGMGRSYR